MDAPARVVVGDDGSEEAGLAWRWVSAQEWDGWTVDIVTAQEPIDYPVRSDDATPHPWQPPHPRVTDGRGRLGAVRHLVAVGDPRAVLLGFADAALMVVGRRGHGVLKALSLGSTTDWLLHGPPCPLVVVKRSGPVRRVLVCADGSDHALDAAEAFGRLPWAAGTDVEVLSVPDHRTDSDQVVRTMLGVLAEAGVAARVAARSGHSGDPREVIVNVASGGVDLVVLGTHGVGISTVRRLLRGSVASYVAHHVPCSVLVADGHRPVEA